MSMASIEQENLGIMPDGSTVHRYTLRNKSGITARLIDYGAILSELWVPNATGGQTNIVCGFETLEQYLAGHPFFGATTGRYANRIAQGRFMLDGKEYSLPINNGPNHLHGGIKGFDKRLWKSEPQDDNAVKFTYLSADGEEGYPGNLSITVIYRLDDNDALTIDYTGITDKPTIVNLTNHSYFNLAGSGDILSHEVTIDADRYTPVNKQLIPTGELAPVDGTPFDFRKPMAIGARIQQIQSNPVGYDHNFVLNSGGKSMAFAARVIEPISNRGIEVHTTEPGIQLYTGNFLDGKYAGVGGVRYSRHCALCLETQHFPNSPNNPSFPSTVLRPGETYRTTTIYKLLRAR